MASLQEFLEEKEQTEKPGFAVKTDREADWALRRIKEKKEELQSKCEKADAEIEKYQEYKEEEGKRIQDKIDYFQGLIAKYAAEKRDNDPKFKTEKLANGRFGFQKQQDEYIFDDDVIIPYLEKSGLSDFVKTTKSPAKAEIKKNFEKHNGKLINPDTGEIIPGSRVNPRDEKFVVKVDK